MNQTKMQRNTHVDKANRLSVNKQCELLSISRSSYYYQEASESNLNLELMRLIDEEFMNHPWTGVPKMTQWLRMDKGYKVNKKRIERLYKIMGLTASDPGPSTSKKGRGKEHKVFPYLLKNLNIEYPNQVWATDITYIPVMGGYLYLCAIIDLQSRYVVGWRLSNTMTAEWCKETLEDAIIEYGKPEIINTDQGAQFTSSLFTNFVADQKIVMSMDGKGRALDNIFIERLWRSVKYENVYLYAYNDGKECYKGLKEYFQYYNNQRRHQSLDYKIPAEVYSQKKQLVA
ncbi:IS3 family transposase [Elizabethkingia anophelis]|uniref:IS3 family transposase n=2 Tax=Elizabethkingia anophelis TaxID=1117645 RepID=UPI00320985CF